MSITDIIYTVLAGGLLGAMGQGIRIAVGLKKLSDSNAQKAAQHAPAEKMDSGRLWVSIFIGFVAGAIGMIVKGGIGATNYQTEAIVTIIAIGYAGSDFIEGFFNTYINKANAIVQVAVPVPVPVPAPAVVVAEVHNIIPAARKEEQPSEPELVADEHTPQNHNALG